MYNKTIRAIIIGILVMFSLISCQKEDFTEVRYSMEHCGDGSLFWKFDSQLKYKELNNESFDSIYKVPNIDGYKYSYKIYFTHGISNGDTSHVALAIIINGEQKKSIELNYYSCKTYTGVLSYYP